jgi:hypothetical protein
MNRIETGDRVETGGRTGTRNLTSIRGASISGASITGTGACTGQAANLPLDRGTAFVPAGAA